MIGQPCRMPVGHPQVSLLRPSLILGPMLTPKGKKVYSALCYHLMRETTKHH